MRDFRIFLETRGAAIAQAASGAATSAAGHFSPGDGAPTAAAASAAQELLSYFALPYVTQPEHHPSFAHLFAPAAA